MTRRAISSWPSAAVRARDDATARARLAERKTQEALDEQIRAEEETSVLREELVALRAELAASRGGPADRAAGGTVGQCKFKSV